MLRRHLYKRILLVMAIALTVVLALVDWRLISRAATYPDAPIMAVEWYRPLAPVAGRYQAALPIATAAPSPEFAEALQQVSEYAATRNSTGLIVMHRDAIVLEQYWQGYDQTSRFNAMSMSKSLVGLLIGQAIAEGSITSLDEVAANYLPEWRRDERNQITLKDLIYMQSGLRNEDSTSSPLSDLVQLYVGSTVEKTALKVPSVKPPGQVFEYNNVNSQILAIVLQRATSMAYGDYLSSQLWQPLAAQAAAVWLDRSNGMAKTFCCFFATARDWARVGQMLLHQGQFANTRIIAANWITEMLTPSPLEATFGKHIWVAARTSDHPNVDTAATVPFLAADTFLLDGRGLQRVFVVPSQSLVIVRIGEQPATWDDSVIPNILVSSLIEP